MNGSDAPNHIDVEQQPMRRIVPPNDATAIDFISRHLSRKECTNFVPQPHLGVSRKMQCYCGGYESDHEDTCKKCIEIPPEQFSAWTSSDIVKKPTNAYGRVVFPAKNIEYRKPAKFNRLSNDTSWNSIYSLFVEHWKLTSSGPPEFVVHVIGSEGGFVRMPSSMTKDIFNGGLMMAIRSTHAWLITDGLNVGPSMAVGRAVFENQSLEWRKDSKINRSIECIGIMPWGRVNYRNDLINESDQHLHSVYYFSDDAQQPGNASLEPNHTHFLMVDDGYRNRSYIEGQFIATLLQNIGSPLEERGFQTPVLSLLVEGDAYSLRCMVENLVAKIPVLVCKGTGRAADLVAGMRQHYSDEISGLSDGFMKELKLNEMKMRIEQKLTTWLKDSDEKGRDENARYTLAQLSQDVANCFLNADLIYIFDVSVSDPRELDSALLSCLLDSKRLDIKGQLWLAQQWNRSDVAQNQILRQHSMNTQLRRKFYPFLSDALINGQLEFVKMYFENGVQAQNYLSVSRLRNLYIQTAVPASYLGHVLSTQVYNKRSKLLRKRKNEKATFLKGLVLNDIFLLIRKFTRRYRNQRYERDTRNDQNDACFEQPFQELLIWAVLVNKPELASYFWENAEMPLLCAIVGTLLAKRMADSFRSQSTDIYDNLLRAKDMLESLAIGLINEAFEASPEKSCDLLRETICRWGGLTCLDLAALAEDQAFLATSCCQYAIFEIWCPKFDVSAFGTVMSTLFVFPIFFYVKFDSEHPVGRPARCTRCKQLLANCTCLSKTFTSKGKNRNIIYGMTDGDQMDGLNSADSAVGEEEMMKLYPANVVVVDRWDAGRNVEPLDENVGNIAMDQRGDHDEFYRSIDRKSLNDRVPTYMDDDDCGAESGDGMGATKTFLRGLEPDGGVGAKLNVLAVSPGQRKRARNLHSMGNSISVDSTTSWEHLSRFQKIVKFYSSPISKFTLHTVSYLAFLVLFAYVLLFGFRWRMTVAEIVLHIWIFTLFLEELRIALNYPGRTLWIKLVDWWNFSLIATWNRMDFVTTVSSILVFSLRWSPVTFAYARLALVISFVMYLVKIFKIYFVNGYLGPKVIMIKRMSWDLVMFLLVLVIFFLSYTIGSIALIHPGREFTGRVFVEVFKMGTWEIFGELNDETSGGPTASCHVNTSHPSAYTSAVDCSTLTWPVPVMLAFYLFFGNILLINMLIAIFAHIFENVQNNAEQIWKYQMFFLIEEYRKKPFLPAPFIIFQHVWMLGVYISNYCSKKKTLSQFDEAQALYNESVDRSLLSVFERVCRADFLYNQRRMEAVQIDHVIKDISSKCTQLTEHYSRLEAAVLLIKRDVVSVKQMREDSVSESEHVVPMSRLMSTMSLDEEKKSPGFKSPFNPAGPPSGRSTPANR